MRTGTEAKSNESGGGKDTAKLPPDGTPVYVSDWRRNALWISVVVYGVTGLCILAYLIAKGSVLVVVVYLLIYALAVAASARAAITGLILASDGVIVRSLLRTRRWHWDEILRFELQREGRPRLLLKLRGDGRCVGIYGFYARSKEERSRAAELLAALERRREAVIRSQRV
jgi:hypothetical protein